MKKIIVTILTVTVMALVGCGDNSTEQASTQATTPAVVQTPDRTLSLYMSDIYLMSGNSYYIDVTGVAASNSGVEISASAEKSGVFFINKTGDVLAEDKISIVPDPATGVFYTRMLLKDVKSGTPQLKAFSTGNAPAFSNYSTAVTFYVK